MLRFANKNLVQYLTHTKHGYDFIPVDQDRIKNDHQRLTKLYINNLTAGKVRDNF
jgi:hypothetical protein